MWLTDENAGTVDLDFYAEVTNSGLTLEGVTTTLAAGRVDTAQPLDQYAAVTANQYIAGYEPPAGGELGMGAVEIQTLYPAGEVDSTAVDTLYLSLSQETLPARRVLLWYAQTYYRVCCSVKLRNDASLTQADK